MTIPILVRDSEATGNPLTKIALTVGAPNPVGAPDQLVTAGRNAGGHLELTLWESTVKTIPVAIITKKGTATGAAITDVAIQNVENYRVLTATRLAESNLQLTTWSTSHEGLPIKEDEQSVRGSIGPVALATGAGPDGNLAVTAVGTGGHLSLISWRISASGAITKLASIKGNPVLDSIAVVSTNEGLAVTAIRNGNGALELSTWGVGDVGQLSHLDTATGGPVSDLDMTLYTTESDVGFSNPRSFIMTVSRNANGQLGINIWRVNDWVGKITHLGSLASASVTVPAIDKIGVPFTESLGLTAVRNASGRLAVQTWHTENQYMSIINDYSIVDEAVQEIAVKNYNQIYAATAVRTTAGNIKVISWRSKI